LDKIKGPTHDQLTRKGIALVVLVPTVLFYGATFTGMLAHLITVQEMTAMIAGISPVQALAAAVVGFYFAKKDDG
jgi:hypothetical protein